MRILQPSGRLTIAKAPQQVGPASAVPAEEISSSYAALLHSLVNALPDGVVIVAATGTVLFMNAAAERLLAVGCGDEWLSDGWFLPDCTTAYPPEQFPTARALRGETCEEIDIFLRNEARPHGTWLTMSANPWSNASGALVGAVAVFRDVTEARKSSGVLGRLSAAVETTSDAVVMTDLHGTIVYVNRAFEATTGYSREEAIGATPRILKSGTHDKRYYEAMWSTIRSGEVFRDVLINRRKDGVPFYAEQTITPIVGRDGLVSNYVSLMRDITERRASVQRETELSLARDVQQRLYPHQSTKIRGYDVAGVMHPAGAQMMSGDYFDVFPIAGGSIGIALGDVCGHGISAAMIMAQTRAYVRSFAMTHSDVNTVMSRVNDALTADLAPENFVTLVLAVFDECGRTFTYANGGHLSGYVLDERGAIRETLSSNGLALGFFSSRVYEPRPPVDLRPGELLLLFSDGIVESESPAGEEFGTDRALKVVAAHRDMPAAAVAEQLYAEARAFAAHGPQADDMTVFVCKPTGDCCD